METKTFIHLDYSQQHQGVERVGSGLSALGSLLGSLRLRARLDAWARRSAQRRADARLMSLARQDPRVMADLRAARARHEAESAQQG